MTPEELQKLIAQDEDIKLDFKREYHLDKMYSGSMNRQDWVTYVNGQWDEFIKDILSLTNGNVGVPNKSGFLIIGVDDKKMMNGSRSLYDMSHLNITASQILSKVNGSCQPPIPQISLERVVINQKTIIVITIPPSPYVHETNRQLSIKKGCFDAEANLIKLEDGKIYTEYTAFLRKGENIFPASWIERQELIKDKQFLTLAINERIKSEIIFNLSQLLVKFSNEVVDPCWLLDSIKNQHKLEFGKQILASSSYLFRIAVLLITVSSAYKNLSSHFLDNAIVSLHFFQFDANSARIKYSTYYDGLLKLQRAISRLKNMCESFGENGFKFMDKYNPKVTNKESMNVPCDELVRVMAILYRYDDVLKLSKSILSYLLDPTKPFSEVRLNPSSPIENELERIESEKVSEQEVIEWVLK